MLISGRCHCGNISFALDWRPEPSEISARACTRSFCAKHGGVWTSCPTGSLTVSVKDHARLSKYAFGFDARGPMSPGTARAMARSLRLGHQGGRVRRNGVIEEVPLAQSWRRIDFAGGSATAIAIPWGDLRYRLVLNRHSQHRDLCRRATRCGDRQPRVQLGAALTRIGTWSNPAKPARQSRQRALRRTVTHREIPSVGRGAQCGRRAPHSAARDCQRIPPDGGRHYYGGAIPTDKCALRWVLHAQHAPRPALRRTIARVASIRVE
jgi:hypothetical protein